MPSRLVLWDIDGTLLRSGGIGRSAFDVAVERALGRHPGDHRVTMGGMTDPQITREILTFAAIAEDDIDTHLPVVLEHLESALAEAEHQIRDGGEVLPGIPEILTALHDDPHVTSTVLTGNTKANAAVKLSALGLAHLLDLEVGAYGSDHADRRRLVPVALDRASRGRGQPFEPDHVWVVGDTVHDLACARAGGVRCLLVGTGFQPFDELRHAGADELLPDLSDVESVLALLRG
jgi:phosphoglycolate phosphatase